MSTTGYPIRANFGLLPEPQRSPGTFITSSIVNLTILGVVVYLGMTAKRVIELHKYEQTELIFPTTPPPEVKVKLPPPPKIEQPKLPEVKLDAPRINLPRPEPKPELKPIQMEAKALPVVKAAKPSVILAPQPKAALTAAAPAQVAQAHPSTAPVHLGETFGVTPNPNASRPATVAAIGNPYGGMNGPAVAPRGVVGSTGIGNGTKSGSNAGTVGRVRHQVRLERGHGRPRSFGRNSRCNRQRKRQQLIRERQGGLGRDSGGADGSRGDACGQRGSALDKPGGAIETACA